TQERDEYGQFSGGRSSGRYQDDDERGSSRRSRYDDDDRGSSSSRSRSDDDERFGGYEGRSRGGSHSAEMQERDEYGRFSVSSGNGGRY
ncbi:MAG: hypothetical protein JNG88_16795, partial [Phycisphaerales bacterium]|nr:hypothetical protein [Phycisphaerales bacterium]